MTQSIKTIIKMLILVVTIQSCNQDLTLQTYYVDKELQPGFTSLDVPVSMLKINEEVLTEEQKEAYESVDKLSMIAYVADETNQDKMQFEYNKVKEILKDPKYEELMRGGNSTDGQFIVKCIGGDGDDVDEFILLGHSTDNGFAVVRILGDNMNFNKIMKLTSVLDENSLEQSQIKDITKFFK